MKNYKTSKDLEDLLESDPLSTISPLLQSGLKTLNLNLSPAIQKNIIEYIMLLGKWSKVYNLTAIREPRAILVRHIFDSLAIVPYILGADILDFGTGAGLPGIPLALVLPQCNFVLLDSAHKKTTFLKHVVFSLDIKNIKIITGCIEEFRFDHCFATIVTRATAKPKIVFDKTKHLCAGNGQILIMQGKCPQKKEYDDIDRFCEVRRLVVPYLDEERHILIIKDQRQYL